VSSELPIPGYRFLVTLDPADAYLPADAAAALLSFVGGGFQEVKGLSADLEVLAHPEGGRNDAPHQLPVRHSWGRLTLKRGFVREPGLWDWYRAGLTGSLGARRDGAIVLLTPLGLPAAAWHFRAGLAVHWGGPELGAMQNAVAVESLDIAHEGIEQVLLSAPEPEAG
jgi:phage tail-like protein